MRFVCQSCKTKYAIDDSRVRGKILKIRCKSCGNLITVSDSTHPPEREVSSPSLPSDPGHGMSDRTMISDGPPPDLSRALAATADWYISFDGEQEGPHSLEQARSRLREEKGDKEVHAWRDGFKEWLPVLQVPELAAAMRAATAAAAAAKSGRAASAATSALGGNASDKRSGPTATTEAKPVAASAAPAPAYDPDATVTMAAAAPLPSASVRSAPSAMGAPPPAAAAPGSAAAPRSDAGAATVMGAAAPLSPTSPHSSMAIGKTPAAVARVAAATGNGTGAAHTNGSSEKLGSLLSFDAPSVGSNMPTGTGEFFAGFPQTSTGSGPAYVSKGRSKLPLVAALVVIAGLGSAVGYLMLKRQASASPGPAVAAVTPPPAPAEPAPRPIEDNPVFLGDPVHPHPAEPSPAAASPTGTQPVAPAAHSGHPHDHGAATSHGGKGTPALSSEQSELAKIYGDTDKSSLGALPAVVRHDAPQAQVSDAAIMGVVNRNKKMLTTCWERVLKHEGQQKNARVDVELKIGISGSVTDVSFGDPEYKKSEIGTCLRQTIKRWHFPEQGSEYETAFPLLLQAQ